MAEEVERSRRWAFLAPRLSKAGEKLLGACHIAELPRRLPLLLFLSFSFLLFFFFFDLSYFQFLAMKILTSIHSLKLLVHDSSTSYRHPAIVISHYS